MATQLGNTTKAFGREYNISVSNHGGESLLSSYGLRENTLIVSSKVDNNLLDVGSYSLFITDADGNPVRLTYTIQPGSGLYPDPNDTDILRMVIDESSIMADDGDELYVNKHNIIDEYTLTVDPDEEGTSKRGRIAVVTANLDKAGETRWGIVKADENTTYIPYNYFIKDEAGDIYESSEDDPRAYPVESGIISVNTQNLDTVDDTLNRDGIVRHSSEMFRTIKAEDGKLQVLTYNLDKATADRYGVIKSDDITIKANDEGVVSVLTEGLEHSENDKYGISKGDKYTINVKDGIFSVNTRNLSAASYTELGVVSIDAYSMTVSEGGKIEVNRFNEIESILNNNPSEHASFQADIEDLKNRVSILETIAKQEVIDFLLPVGDPTTELPQPIFDRETWTVDHYSDRKTIAFQIQANCKFNINVEYKSKTNDYSQVTLLNVKYGDDAAIPANQLANTQFEATGNTVKTIYLTFAVKNYDKDDNEASINTQVIVSATCINDSSIKQTGFHIFKCWNNIAFTEDRPEDPPVPEPEEIHESYWYIHPGTERLAINGNSIKDNTISYNKNSSANFYFNSYVKATYTYYDSSTYNWIDEDYELNQSSNLNKSTNSDINGQYDINIMYQEVDENGNAGILTPTVSWLNTGISATYNTTKQFNVLTLTSNNGLTKKSRGAYIYCYFNTSTMGLDENSNIKTDFIEDKKIELSYIETFERKVIDKDNLVKNKFGQNTSKTWSGTNGLTPIEKIETLELELNSSTSRLKQLTLSEENLDTELTSLKNNGTISNVEVEEIKSNVKALKTNRNTVSNAKVNFKPTSVSESSIKETTLTDVLTKDIEEFELVKEKLNTTFTSLGSKVPTSINKNAYIAYFTYIKELDKLSDKIINEYNKFEDLTIKNKVELINSSYIKFFYNESMDLVQPVINVSSNIAYGGSNGITFNISRNSNSLLTTSSNGIYDVNIYYSFINKNGDIVNEEGLTKSTYVNTDYNLTIPGIDKLTYNTTYKLTAINGQRTEMQDEYSYYNVIVVDYKTEDNASFLGIGEGNKDAGIVYWDRYNPSNTSDSSNISDNIYAVFKLTGQDASFGLFSQKYSFWTVNLKDCKYSNRNSGFKQALAQANTIEFIGLSKIKHSKASSQSGVAQSIKIGRNLYILKSEAKKVYNSESLLTLAQKYYENKKASLVYDINKVPVKVANNVIGITINNIKINNGAWDNSFYLEPKVTWSTSGSLQSKNENTAGDSLQNYTFGNAKISAIRINPWDDYAMEIIFTITGGTTTKIPNGALIQDKISSANGKTNFVFLQNSKSYEYTQFYSNYTVIAGDWKNNSCTVTFKLFNKYSLTQNVINSNNTLMYSNDSGKLENVYTENGIKYTLKDNSRDYTRDKSPLLGFISGIKFWVGFKADGVVGDCDTFESSTSSLGNTITFTNYSFDMPIYKNLNITNALYKNVTTTSTTKYSYM